MAFDRPLEADKVDDLGLFSSFVRAPIVGVLMWALGGDEAKKREAEEQRKELHEKLAPEDQESEEKPINAAQLQLMIEQNRNRRNGKKKLPNLIGSDLSDFGDLAIMHSESSDFDDSERDDSDFSGGLRRTKKMSWSDQSGQHLCEVIDETSVTHEPKHNATSTLPVALTIKSAVKRSRSMRAVNGSSNLAGNDPSLRFLPKGLSAGHGGIIYPTHPNSQQSKPSTGYVSPEGWGWYITTTPPTPDMYYHSNKLQKKTMTQNSIASRRSTTLTNPAFKTGGNKTAVGWPSVPL